LVHIEEQITSPGFFWWGKSLISSHTGRFPHTLGKNKKWHQEQFFVFKAHS